ncbi:MAG: family 20 glycosylhydrolase [Prevotella sp.]|nr:family 20 glycosylhydrolase [Prevotella sp.]
MRHKRILFSAFLLFAFITVADAKITHLLPRPQKVVMGTGSMTLPSKIRFNAEQSDRVNFIFADMLGVEVTDDASATLVNIETGKSISGSFNHQLALYPNEAYQLEVTSTGINIKAATEIGVIRAVQTLAQMAEGYDGTPELECCTITDWPAFKLRGLMHDIGRSFISFEELKKQLKLFARFKMNTFHFHLTENQGWRFEVKAYPQLTKTSSMTRFAGKYYTQEQCRELEELAYQYGITIIPEIDMPGHSGAFKRAMGHDMQTDEGVAELKVILKEVAQTFTRAPYIHIGGDEVTITYPNFLQIMGDYVHSLGKKVVCWNKLVSGAPSSSYCDMTQMWATRGTAVSGLPNIDCRYNYVNHFDVFADLAGIYRSNIYYEQRGTKDVAGTITAVWNDRYVVKESDIMLENNVYASVLASVERAWIGGGKQYIEKGGAILPNSGDEYDEFADWERRFLFHKAHSLSGEPIPYVKQTNIKWHITDAFPNGGNSSLVLPPETLGPQSSYEYNGQNYGVGSATGGTVYLRHVWGTTIPGYYSNPQLNNTAYAWTYIYSPEDDREVGAIIEFQNYSRSEVDAVPANYSWDKKGSRIWFNDSEIKGPKWDNNGVSINNETPLRNENAVRRKPVTLVLKKGWNKVFMKLPYVNASGIRLNKWMFTFVLTDKEGKNAIDGLVYSPNQVLDDNASTLSERVNEINSFLAKAIGTEPGCYNEYLAESLQSVIDEISATFGEIRSAEERSCQLSRLNAAYEQFLSACETEGPIIPTASTDGDEHWYYFCSTLRNSRYTRSNGANAGVTGGDNDKSNQMYWKIVERADGTYDIINRADGSYLSPDASYNTQITTSSTQPSKGWTFKASDTPGMLIITCGNVQLNQTNLNDKVYNWSNQSTLGNDKTDTGCQFTIREVVFPSEEDVDLVVRVTSDDNVMRPDQYGTWDSKPWTKGWTSNESNVLAGVTMTSASAQFNQSYGIYERYVLALKPSQAGATDEIVITAPEGYVITGYSMKARLFTAHEPYTLENAQQSVEPVTNAWRDFGAENLDDTSTSFTIKATGSTNNQYLCITDFTVTLRKKTTTNISEMKIGNDDQTMVFDLQGRRIQGDSPLPKGIYIRGNKKFVVK